MLRIALIVGSVLALTITGGLLLTGHAAPGLGVAALWALLLVVGILFERRHYKRVLGAPPEAPWAATNERFIDPETGAELLVYFNPKTGGRAYVRSKAAPTRK
jgi:hypothetical protein